MTTDSALQEFAILMDQSKRLMAIRPELVRLADELNISQRDKTELLGILTRMSKSIRKGADTLTNNIVAE